jgi:hypothetical protein
MARISRELLLWQEGLANRCLTAADFTAATGANHSTAHSLPAPLQRHPPRSDTCVEDRPSLRVEHPKGSQFNCYEPYQVQELVLAARVVCNRRERWLTPESKTILAPLPGAILGHFGPELRRFVPMQYHQGHVTVERLAMLLPGDRRQHLQAPGDSTAGRFPEEKPRCGARRVATANWVVSDASGIVNALAVATPVWARRPQRKPPHERDSSRTDDGASLPSVVAT